MAVFKTILERLYVMMNEKKNAHQRGLKILGVISVTFFLFAFSLTAFSQDSTPSESKVELADGKIRIVYAFDAPVVASTSQMDDTLLAKTHKIIFDEENSWAQTYSVESIQAAENLLGIDFLISRNIEKYAFNPNKKDTLSVQATESGKIANTTYTCYRTYNGYGVTIVADTIWDGSSLNHKEYIFPFSQSQYTVKEIPFIMSSGEKASIYEVLDKKGNIAGQYVMFNKDATNYLLYLIPYTQVEQTKEERQGSAIKKLLNDLIIDM